MTSKRLIAFVLLLGVAGCRGDELTTISGSPTTLNAEPIALGTVRLEWPSVSDPDVSGYVIERRTNLTGPFAILTDGVLPASVTVVYFDENLDAETFYGYRVRAVTRFGEWSESSPVAGARTPAMPGIEVAAQTSSPNPQSLDGDGYFVSISGPGTASGSLGPAETRRFNPLPSGQYAVTLSGIEPNCLVQGDTVRTAAVTDQGIETITPVRFQVSCRDPGRGTISVVVSGAGDSLDADGYLLDVQGIADDASLPDTARIYTRLIRLPAGSGGAQVLDHLRPGSYIVSLLDLASNCSVQGAAQRTVPVTPLSIDSLRFDVICQGSEPPAGNQPFTWTNIFSPQSATGGQKVSLTVVLDLTAPPTQDVSAVQAELRYDAAVLRLDSISPAQLEQFTPNISTAGLVNWLAFTTGTPPRGAVQLARFNFTSIGAQGSTSRTRTMIQIVGAGDGATQIDTLVRVVEGTFTTGSGPQNQAPQAEANGPYTGTAGSPVSFSASGSTDPDGAIASYSWSFSDGGSASGAAPSHVFSAAGSYSATLTVSDNLGATGTDQASVTIVGAGGGGSGALAWASAFGAINPADSLVSLTIRYDLSADIPETAGSEALQSWWVDSLQWNPAVLRYHSFTFGPGGFGSVNPTSAVSQGKLTFSGTQPAGNSTGQMIIATVRFKVIGTAGSSTTTRTSLGGLTGTPATGNFNYLPKTTVEETSITAP